MNTASHHPPPEDPAEARAQVLEQVAAILDGERDAVANAANVAAVLAFGLPALNWVGFYFRRGDQLVLGPFQGRPACIRIPLGRGVCGTAAARAESIRVPDVHAFPGHIACDSASNAELVVPLLHHGRVVGVLDLDSPVTGRFSTEDQACIEAVAALWTAGCDLEGLR